MEEELTIGNNEIVESSRINYKTYEAFKDYVDVKEITLKGYETCIKAFIIYLQAREISHPTRQTIKEYKSFLDNPDEDIVFTMNELNMSNRRPYSFKLSAGSKHQYLRGVKQFFEWTEEVGAYPNIAKNIKPAKVKVDNSKRDSFTAEDIKTILDSINTNKEVGARDYAIILLCVTCGLRIIEIQRANIEDLQKVRNQLRLYIQGKGRDDKDDYKKVIPQVEENINKYLSYRIDIKSTDPLFASLCTRTNYGGRLTEPSISRIIKNRFKQAGYDTKRLTAHSLRHTSNTLLFESGADLFKVQRHARHSDPKTTEIYIHDKEKETAENEQAIYNMIFNKERDRIDYAIKQLDGVMEELEKLPEEDKEKLIIKLMKTINKDQVIH